MKHELFTAIKAEQNYQNAKKALIDELYTSILISVVDGVKTAQKTESGLCYCVVNLGAINENFGSLSAETYSQRAQAAAVCNALKNSTGCIDLVTRLKNMYETHRVQRSNGGPVVLNKATLAVIRNFLLE